MATVRRRGQPQERDLYGPARPATWLDEQELADLSLEEQHQLATARRRCALDAYARERRMSYADVERWFLVHPERKFTDRAEALRWIAEHVTEASGLDIPARRLVRLVAERHQGDDWLPGAGTRSS